MTKQQAISLKLAQWVGFNPPGLYAEQDEVFGYRGATEFNPFSDNTEGRAQFAECVIKGIDLGLFVGEPETQDRSARVIYWRNGWRRHIEHDNTPEGITAATLEAIYYAIGGNCPVE